jgi:hypothetical protein
LVAHGCVRDGSSSAGAAVGERWVRRKAPLIPDAVPFLLRIAMTVRLQLFGARRAG